MNAARHLALESYYRLSQPFRERRRDRLQHEGRVPVCVLFYHRVADWCPNGWTISSGMFQRQLEWLRTHCDVVSLEEAQQRIAAGVNHRPTACITFDDGYADNFDIAIPLLLREKVPFTYFVATRHVVKGLPFPHDAQAGYPLRPNKPDELRLLVRAGVEVGSHTLSHANLGAVSSVDALRREIVDSKHELEDLIGREVRYFAFPYGMPENMSPDAFRMAYQAGYAGVCSAYGAYNHPGGDAFHLRRFHADPEFVRFRNWLTLDPRKLQQVEAFDPGDYRADMLSDGTQE